MSDKKAELCISRGDSFRQLRDVLADESLQLKGAQKELAVWYGPMPESNGKTNWTAILHRKGESFMNGPHITIERSEYADRVRYEADRVRHIIGELSEEPDILAYDADLHSGYVKPAPERNKEVFVGVCTPNNKDLTSFVYGVFKSDEEALEHFQKFGDKDCEYRVTREHMILEWDR